MWKAVRIGAAAVLAATLAVSAAACGSDEPTASDEKVTLSYAVWDKNQVPVIEELAAAFTAESCTR